FGLPARLEPGHGLEHQVVELLGPAPVQRNPRRYQPAAQPASMPVAPARPGTRSWLRTVLAGLHSDRAYRITPVPGYPVRPGADPGQGAQSTTRSRRRAQVVALPAADRYRHGCIRGRPGFRAKAPRGMWARWAGGFPSLLAHRVQASSRLHADLCLPRFHRGTRPAGPLRGAALLRLVRKARRAAGGAPRLGSGPAARRAGPGPGR